MTQEEYTNLEYTKYLAGPMSNALWYSYGPLIRHLSANQELYSVEINQLLPQLFEASNTLSKLTQLVHNLISERMFTIK